MIQEIKKNVSFFILIFAISVIMSIGAAHEGKMYGSATFLLISIITGACLLMVSYDFLFTKKEEPRVKGINGGAANIYLTLSPDGFISINLNTKNTTVVIPTAIKLYELLNLKADERIDIDGIVAVASEDQSKIDLYFPYNGSRSWLIIVRREDLSNLVN